MPEKQVRTQGSLALQSQVLGLIQSMAKFPLQQEFGPELWGFVGAAVSMQTGREGDWNQWGRTGSEGKRVQGAG